MFSVTLASEVFDPWGSIVLDIKPESDLSTLSRRVTRTATLDGGATIEDLGYCAADSTLNIQILIRNPDDEGRLLRLIKLYPTLTLATRYGAFRGVVDYYHPQAGGASLRFLVHRQLN